MEGPGGYIPMHNHANDIFNLRAVFKKRVSGGRHDQSLDLWEFDVFKGFPELTPKWVTRPCNL